MVELPSSFVWGLITLAIISTIGLGGAVIQLRYCKVDKSDCQDNTHECRAELFKAVHGMADRLTRLETKMDTVLKSIDGRPH